MISHLELHNNFVYPSVSKLNYVFVIKLHEHHMCVCPWVCAHQPWTCPCDNFSPVYSRITKFGPEVQNTFVKIPIVLGGNCQTELKEWKFTSFWAGPNDTQAKIINNSHLQFSCNRKYKDYVYRKMLVQEYLKKWRIFKRVKPKNDMMFHDIYNCICQNTKK